MMIIWLCRNAQKTMEFIIFTHEIFNTSMKPQSHNSWNLCQTYHKGMKIIHGNSSILSLRKMELWCSTILLPPSASSFSYREQIVQCRLKKIKKTQEKNPIIFILDDLFHSLEHWCKVEGFYKASTRLCTMNLSCRHIFMQPFQRFSG